MLCLLLVVLGVAAVQADITGSNPANGACLCLSASGVNVRGTACGTVIGQSNTGSCYKYKGQKQTCVLSGVTYDFFSLEYGSGGWIAGIYLNNGQASQCSSSGGTVCNGNQVENALGRCVNHASAYSCGDGTTCQCVAAIFKFCPPIGAPTGTWKRGIKVMSNCASIPKYTAIATFPNGSTYSGHAAVFLSCNSRGIQVYDQWCGHPFSSRLIRPGGRGVSNDANGFYVINR